jgi:hypothetical protein
VTLTAARLSARAAHNPPKPPPTITTRGAGSWDLATPPPIAVTTLVERERG